MAEIREKLILEDKFSEAFSRYIAQTDKAISKMEELIATQSRMAASAGAAGSKLDGAGAALDKIDRTGGEAADSLNNVWKYSDGIAASSKGTISGLTGMASSLMKIVAAYVSLKAVGALVTMSDTVVQTTARLNIMNDGLQTTEELNRMIYESAQRTRSSYLDTASAIASMGANAGNAFASNTELIAFMEQVNKQFAIGGASSQGQAAAMLQLTQAMASGALRGEELNSILENAPGIARAIEQYMGVAEGSIKQYAEQGLITAEVVKNALLSTADETNKKFEDIPLQFSQAWTNVKNAAIMAMEPVLKKVNDFLNGETGQKALNGLIAGVEMLAKVADQVVDLLISGAEWVADNWDLVSSVIAAAGIAMVGAAAVSAVAWAAANWQILAVVAGLALVIYSARKLGATWEQIGGAIGVVFAHIYANAMNSFIIPIQRKVAMLVNFLGNAFQHPLVALEVLFADISIGIIEKIENVASALEGLINLIPGVNVDITSWLDNLTGQIKTARDMAKDNVGYTTYIDPMDYIQIDDAWQKGWETGSKYGSYLDDFDPDAIAEKLSNSISESAVGSDISGIATDTSAIKKSVSLAEEDMKMLADMAERQYINKINLTSQAPVITITGANTGNTEQDRRNMADAIKRILLEQAASSTVNSYAMP